MSDLRNYIVGRSTHSDIRLDDQSISRSHAEITISKDGRYYLTDCQSSQGTFIVRSGEWSRITQSFVAADEPLLLGRYQCTVSALLAQVRAGTANSGGVHRSENIKSKPAERHEDGLPEGRVTRDPSTGEIIGLDDE